MIAVNELIQQAFTRTGLVGEGQAVNGTKAKSALHELNDLVQVLNQQEYIGDNIKVYDVRAGHTITIGPSKDFDIQAEFAPSHIKTIARENGNHYVSLIPSNYESIINHNSRHLATEFTYNVEFDPEARTNQQVRPDAIVVNRFENLPPCKKQYVEEHWRWYATETNTWGFAMGVGSPSGPSYVWAVYGDSPTEQQLDGNIYQYDHGCIKGTITLDSNHSNRYKVVFISEIPEYGLDDTILLQNSYKSLLLAGLTYKLAVRYKLQEWIATYKEDFDDQKSLIKRINQTNRNLLWGNVTGSYMDDYINGRSGGDW